MELVPFILSKDLPGRYNIEMGGQKEVLKVVQIERLRTGTFIEVPLYVYSFICLNCGDLTIENGLDFDAVVVLAYEDSPQSAVYIRSHDSYTISGNFIRKVYFTYGKDWDSYSKEFTEDKTYKRFEDIFDFNKYSYKITLHPVTGGTARTKYMSEEEFPNLG